VKNPSFVRLGQSLFEWLVFAILITPLVVFISLLLKDGSNTPSPAIIHQFKALTGPNEPTVISAEQPTSYHQYEKGGKARLALLLTDESSHWLGLVHGLETIGIPFTITRDYREAIRHKVIMVYPSISARLMGGQAFEAIIQHPGRGGTLIGFNVEKGLENVFSFKKTLVSTTRSQLHLDPLSPLTQEFTDSNERIFPIDRQSSEEPKETTIGYPKAHFVIARYEDGMPAIIGRESGNGNAYAIGFDLGHLLLIGYDNRQESIARSYNNEFEPALDVLLRMLRHIYEKQEPDAVTLGTVPFGKTFSLIWTHDIDYTRSIINAVEYANLEARYGVHGTYFIQTKYVRDWNDDIFFNDDAKDYLQKIDRLGGEIASHSVSHSRQFRNFSLGSGTESYPLYQPRVMSEHQTLDGSILGELRVSRFLLESLLPSQHVDSFRPGHLSDPFSLPEALEATHYHYSSSVSANDSLTHLPFRLTYSRGWATQTPIFEFPVTIEDEEEPSLMNRLTSSIELCQKIGRYGGLVVVLIHPDILGGKIQYEEEMLKAFQDQAYMTSLREFGNFWKARTSMDVDSVREKPDRLRLEIKMPQLSSGVTLRLPHNMRVVSVNPDRVGFEQRGNDLIITQPVEGSMRFEMIQRPAPSSFKRRTRRVSPPLETSDGILKTTSWTRSSDSLPK
jgi:hypothetical protein